MQLIYQYVFMGLPEDLARVISELIDDRARLDFGGGAVGLATPIRIISQSADNITVELSRFHSAAKHILTGWRDGDETRIKVFPSDLNWRDNNLDGWFILYNRLMEIKKFRLGDELKKDRLILDASQKEKLQAKWDTMGDETKKKFRRAWKIWKDMIRQYEADFQEGRTAKMKPTMEDWQVRVVKFWKVGIDRLRNVKKMGDAGIIK